MLMGFGVNRYLLLHLLKSLVNSNNLLWEHIPTSLLLGQWYCGRQLWVKEQQAHFPWDH